MYKKIAPRCKLVFIYMTVLISFTLCLSTALAKKTSLLKVNPVKNLIHFHKSAQNNYNYSIGQDRGGGDICEDSIQQIASDLSRWIHLGQHRKLSLPLGINYEDYQNKMLRSLQKATVSCVSEGDKNYPVEVEGVAKTCMYNKIDATIICDTKKFQALSVDNRYVLIHHEFAGLADIEIPQGGKSNYDVSPQIKTHLQGLRDKKLVPLASLTKDPDILCENDKLYFSFKLKEDGPEARFIDIRSQSEVTSFKFSNNTEGHAWTEDYNEDIKVYSIVMWLGQRGLMLVSNDLNTWTSGELFTFYISKTQNTADTELLNYLKINSGAYKLNCQLINID